MEPIALSDDSNDCDVVDLSGESNDDVIEVCEINGFRNCGRYDAIIKENELLFEFIEKCLDLEHSLGMIRVIDRSLIPAYYSTTKIFKKSDLCHSVLSRAIMTLERDPNHKFSHVKMLCIDLKEKSKKLSNIIANKAKRKIQDLERVKRKMKKRKATQKIILSDDSDTNFEVPLIDSDEDFAKPSVSQDKQFVEFEIDEIPDTKSTGITDIHRTDNSYRGSTTGKDLKETKVKLGEIDSINYTSEVNTKSIINSSDKSNSILPQDRIKTTLKRPCDRELKYNYEVCCTEISSTVLDDCCNDEKDIVTTTQEINDDENSLNLNGNICGDNVLTDSKSIEDIIKTSDVTDIIVIDKKTFTKALLLERFPNSSTEHDNNAFENEIKHYTIEPVLNDVESKESLKDSESMDVIVLDENDTLTLTPSNETCKNDINTEDKIPTSAVTVEKYDKEGVIVLRECEDEKQPIKMVRNKNKTKKVFKEKNITGSAVTDSNDKSCKANDLIIIVEDEDNECVTMAQKLQNDKILKISDITASYKDNYNKSNDLKTDNLIVIDDEDDSNKIPPPTCNYDSNITNCFPMDEDTLLVPHKAEVFEGPTEDSLIKRINEIADQIAGCRARVRELEEAEVHNDSMWSPYIQCEKYKAKIVRLYKELCKLTGERAVKRREVRLTAADARSQLCVTKLEDFINSNIGPDGLPHFPDFQDVLQCVKDANKEGQLGWNRNDVMREANALFTYCGRALQSSRQRREWRDMLSLVKSEVIEDPADNDPELMARLQANKKTAIKTEKELLDRYCEMSYASPSTECTKENDIYESDSENDSKHDKEENHTSTQEPIKSSSSQLSNTFNKPTDEMYENLRKAVITGLIGTFNAEESSVVNGSHVKRVAPIRLDTENISKNSKSYTRCPPTKHDKPSPELDPKNILNHNFNLVTKVVLNRIDVTNVSNLKVRTPLVPNLTSVKEASDLDISRFEVKKEPCLEAGIQDELDNLGVNFTATVFDIEDPFLIIEISSDSEVEDDET